MLNSTPWIYVFKPESCNRSKLKKNTVEIDPLEKWNKPDFFAKAELDLLKIWKQDELKFFKKVPRSGGEPGIFLVFVYSLSQAAP